MRNPLLAAAAAALLGGCAGNAAFAPAPAGFSRFAAARLAADAVSSAGSVCPSGAVSLLSVAGHGSVHLERDTRFGGDVDVDAGDADVRVEHNVHVGGTLEVVDGHKLHLDPDATVDRGVFVDPAAVDAQASLASAAARTAAAFDDPLFRVPMVLDAGETRDVPATAFVTVVDATTLHLGKNALLTLSGSQGHRFIVDVAGDVHLEQGAQIAVRDGIRASDVAFVALGRGQVHLDRGTRTDGSWLAPNGADVHVEREAAVAGGIVVFGGDVRTEQNVAVGAACFSTMAGPTHR